jgi:hypothetical protein
MQQTKVENSDFSKFVARVVRAAGRRVADGDIDGLSELVALRADLDAAIENAVIGLRAEPHAQSWGAIAARLGVTRQAAMQRWPQARGARRPGGQPSHLR